MSNYKITYLGETGIFTKENLQILKERFARASGRIDMGKLALTPTGYRIQRDKPCICRNYRIVSAFSCGRCPFYAWTKHLHPQAIFCAFMIKKFDPKLVVKFNLDTLAWFSVDQTEVSKVFRRARKFLARAVEIPGGDSDA